jgi:predicted P-loop ATPase
MIRVPVAIFESVNDTAPPTTVDMSVDELHAMATVVVKNAEDAPLFVYGRLGSKRSPRGSYRIDDNCLGRTGWVLDYDGSTPPMPFAEGKQRCNDIGLACFGYTTKRHTPGAPRWRIAGPFSREVTPAELPHLMARINGLIGGVAAPESAKLTQSWFIARVDGVLFDSFVGDGDACLDELDALDASAIPIQGGPAPRPRAKKGAPDYGELSRDDLEELILDREHDFGPANELLRRDAHEEISQPDAEANLRDVYDRVAQAKRDRAWSKARSSISRWAQHVYNRVAKQQGRFFRKLVAHLQENELWRLTIRFNRFTQQIEVCNPFPPTTGQLPNGYRPLRDPVDILEAMMAVQEDGFPKAGKATVTDAIVVVAEHRPHHPPQDWLRSLPAWDGIERINKLFTTYFPGALPPESDPQARDEVTRYFEKVGECFAVGAIARIMQPGCKLDCLPCIVSPQGWDKSKGLAALVPAAEWFTDDLSTNVTDRDSKESLCGKWVIELSEFPHIRRDIDRVKAFFSRQTDRYRRAYGRLNTDHPRQCVFIATANELEFIDITGNRRVWPVPLAKSVDVAAIERDREQLWAEALHWYDQGFAWWLPPGIEAIAGEMQDAFVEADEWDGLILDFLDRRFPAKPDGTRERFTRRQVVQGLGFSYLDPGAPQFPKATDEKRVERRLRRLGFCPDPHRPRRGSRRERFWIVAKP